MSSIGHKPGPPYPDRIEVVIEIPKDSRNKYEVDDETGAVWLDRTLFTATRYPENYGYIPDSLAGDGDPLDVLVIMDEPVFPGCHIWARPVAVLEMRDEAGPDAKVLAVPFGDPRWSHIQDIGDLSDHLRKEIHHFFEVYKALEPGKSTETREWARSARAKVLITEARDALLPSEGRARTDAR